MTGLGSRATLTKPQYLAFWDLCLKICVMVLLIRFSGVKKKLYFTICKSYQKVWLFDCRSYTVNLQYLNMHSNIELLCSKGFLLLQIEPDLEGACQHRLYVHYSKKFTSLYTAEQAERRFSDK